MAEGTKDMNSGGILLDIKFDIEGKRESFEQLFPDRQIVDVSSKAAFDPEGIRYAVAWRPTPGLLASLPDLEVIFSLGAGVDHIICDETLPDLPLVRFVDPDLTGRMVEWVTLQVLLHMRRQRAYDGLQRDRKWIELPPAAAREFTVGIMGLGELGQACASVLRALDFNIVGWSRSRKTIDGIKSFAGDGELTDFLGSTDILVGLLPYTPETHGIFNRSLFGKMNRSGPLGAPVFINAGRGKSQVETEIISCLDDGTLAGVSLDVFETEPLSADSPLWTFDNAVLTPHVAAVSAPEALANHVKRQIERHEAEEPLQFLVDRDRGY